MSDMQEFDKIADEWRSLNERIRDLRPHMRNAAIEAYRSGAQVKYITDRAGCSAASLYHWLKEAGPGVFSNVPAPIGRPRKLQGINPAVTKLHKSIVDRKVFENADFAWFDDRVRVDCNGKRVLIDVERLDYEGDRELGQLLVSGTDLSLLRKFNEFVNGG